MNAMTEVPTKVADQ